MATVFSHRRGEYFVDQGIPTPLFTREMMGSHVDRCSFCDRQATAFWVNPDIQVCRGCAINKLTKLIADAVIGKDGNLIEQ